VSTVDNKAAVLSTTAAIDKNVLASADPATPAVQGRIDTVYNSIVSPSDPTTPLAKALAKTTPITRAAQTLDINLLPPDQRTEITGGGLMAVYTASNLNLNNTNALTLKGDSGSVFVFIINGDLRVNGDNVVKLEGGVVPDNVYWIVANKVDLRPRFGAAGTKLQGNVVAQGSITLGPRASIEGRVFSKDRIVLNVRTIRTRRGPVTNVSSISAPVGNQPRLVPVTQVQIPNETPALGANLPPVRLNDYRNLWLQQPRSTNYNAAFVVGNSPDRPGESSAGLHNLVRFQENWSPENGTSAAPQPKQSATIKGSFIQIQRSSYATAPYGPIRRGGSQPIAADTGGGLSIFGYPYQRYPSGIAANTLSHFSPPIRQWGFDVGLLSQTPDLFSQRFTENISKTQNYYRQVGRDDPWVQALLCAAAPTDPDAPEQRRGESGTTYTKYAVPDKERPNCPSVVGAAVPYPPN
jgi:hypothetical protein